MSAVPVVIFSDFTCPFSYVTEVALRRRVAEGGVEVQYRAFELYPAPAPLPAPERPGSWEEALRPLASAEGLELRAQAHLPRTRKAHEAARFAHEHDRGDAMRDAVFAAYWIDGRDIGRVDVLVDLGARVGLNSTELKIALDIDDYADSVARDRAAALRAGLTGVPSLMIGTGPSTRVLIGAFSYDDLGAALAQS
jgi:predicted DsbA family dithiol-disulfide isomerase